MLIRTSNYTLDHWPARLDTVNYWGRLTPDRKVVDCREIDDAHRSRLVMQNGLEDGRMIRHNGRWLGLFSALYQSAGRWVVTRNTMTLMDLEAPSDYRTFHVERREKNWMPFVDDGNVYALYSPEKWRVMNLSDGGAVVMECADAFPGWSGGSQFISWQGGWLGVVHRHVSHRVENSLRICRDYEHAFVFMGGAFQPLDISPPFRFLGPGVEFCAGLARHGNDLCLSFGRHDEYGYLFWMTSNSEKAGTGPSATKDAGNGS